MARKRRKSPDSHDRDELSPSLAKADLRTLVRAIEDRRLYNPVRVRPVRGIFTRDAKVVISKPKEKKRVRTLPHRIASFLSRPFKKTRVVRERHMFRVPPRVAICVRRKDRREVLFAKKLTGKGGASRIRRWNEHSGVHCK